MINYKIIIILLSVAQIGQELDLNKRWVNPEGWAKPNLSKLTLIKEETRKDSFIKEMIIKTFQKKKYECVWKSMKILPGYKTSKEIQIANIFSVEAYECKDFHFPHVYLMGLKVIHSRDPELGDEITVTYVILADIDNDGIYESQFDGVQEIVNPGTFMPCLVNHIISVIIRKETKSCSARKIDEDKK